MLWRGLGEAYLLSSFLLTKKINGSRSSIALSHLSHARSLSALHALMLSAPCDHVHDVSSHARRGRR